MAAFQGPINSSNVRSIRVLFTPKDTDESGVLQEALLGFGIIWADGHAHVKNLHETVRYGLVVMDGKIYYRSEGDTVAYDTASVDQVRKDYVTEERRFLLDQFAKVHARLDKMEERLQRIEDTLAPPPLDKTKLPKPPST